jgi:hypothetical protein
VEADVSAATDAVTALADMLKYLGSTAKYTQTKAPAKPPMTMKVLISHPSYKDEALVNAYGIDVTILTFAHGTDFQAVHPEKFDSVVIMGKRYVFDFVHPVVVEDTYVGWTCYSKGKGS